MDDLNDSTHMPRLPLQITVLFCTTLILLAVFQSSALRTLAYDLPPSTTGERVVRLAEQWHELAEKSGAVQISDAISEILEEWRAEMVAE